MLVGTGAWQFDSWQGSFYPAHLKRAEWLAYYALFFKTVELNSSFYHLPSGELFEKWGAEVPKDFKFAVKGSKYITHEYLLNEPEKTVPKFFENQSRMGDRLGPTLWQLPPDLKYDFSRLENFLSFLSGDNQAIEFRDYSWYRDEVYELLKSRSMALVISHHAFEKQLSAPERVITANFIYLRLHAGSEQGRYSNRELQDWADFTEGKTGYLYFTNDRVAPGGSYKDAKRLLELSGYSKGPGAPEQLKLL